MAFNILGLTKRYWFMRETQFSIFDDGTEAGSGVFQK
jgi:hypothetical protein